MGVKSREFMRQSRLLPLIIATALFMENTDSTVISTSLPMIAQDLGDGPDRPQAGADLLSGEPRDLHPDLRLDGRQVRRHGRSSPPRIGVFMAGSLACAASNSLEGFVIARFVQGMGGAMMVPVGRLVLLRSVPAQRGGAGARDPDDPGPRSAPSSGRRSAASSPPISTGAGSSSSTSPSASSASCCAMRFVPNIKEDDTPPLDLIGFLLSGVGLRPAHARLRHRRAASDPGRDLGRLRGRRRDLPRSLCLPRAAHPASGAAARPAEDPDLPRQRRRRLALPHRHRRHSRSCCR